MEGLPSALEDAPEQGQIQVHPSSAVVVVMMHFARSRDCLLMQ